MGNERDDGASNSHGGEFAVSAEAEPGQIFHRTIEPDRKEPHYDILATIAELEETDVEDLPPLYDYVDHLIEKLFSTPPPSKAQVKMEFTYYAYRVVVDQEGNLTLMRQSEQTGL